MILIEYRVPMPFSAEEYQIGQSYTISRKTILDSGGATCILKSGKGTLLGSNKPITDIRINIDEPYTDGPGGCGRYTNKTYILGAQLPDWIMRIAPNAGVRINEETWNAYPYCKSRFTVSFCDKFSMDVESRYLDGRPTCWNIFNLEPQELARRKVIQLDIMKSSYNFDNSILNKPGDDLVTSAKDLVKKSKSKSTGYKMLSTASLQRQLRHQKLNLDEHSFDRLSTKRRYYSKDMIDFNPLFRTTLDTDWLDQYQMSACTTPDPLIKNCHDSKRHIVPKLGDRLQVKLCTNIAENTYNHNTSLTELTNTKRLMTCYKLCRINFPIWPLQSKLETFVKDFCYDLILESHRATWIWQDEWTGLNIDEARSYGTSGRPKAYKEN